MSFVGGPSGQPAITLNGTVSINDTRFYKNEALSATKGLGGAILVEGQFEIEGPDPLVSLSVFGSRFIRNAANNSTSAETGGAIYATRAKFVDVPTDDNIFYRNTPDNVIIE